MKKSVIILVVVFILTYSAWAATIRCESDGSFIVKTTRRAPILAETGLGEWVEVDGRWTEDEKEKEFRFYSDEGVFISPNAARYKVGVGAQNYTANCPPFTFSCRLFNVSIDYCYMQNSTLHAKYSVQNVQLSKEKILRFEKPYLLEYNLALAGGRRLVHSPTSLSKEFADLNITMRKLSGTTKFILTSPVDKPGITALEIRYNNCHQQKFNLYKRKECTAQPSCTIDTDCAEDESCTDGICQELVCGDCQYVENQQCLPYDCCDQAACAPTEACVENTCQPLTCPEGQMVVDQRCVERVCLEDEQLLNGQCQKLDCDEDEFIQDNRCLPLDCGLFQRAVDHRCLSWLTWITSLLT